MGTLDLRGKSWARVELGSVGHYSINEIPCLEYKKDKEREIDL
jgi:hypothetical protein